MPNKTVSTDITPNEMIEKGVELLNDALAEELLEVVHGLNRYKLAGLVVDLLIKMGYCGRIGIPMFQQDYENRDTYTLTVNDRFRFNEEFYVRIKEIPANQSISREDLQEFIESMVSLGGKKAVYFTAYTFSPEASEYANSLKDQKLELVDGEDLVSLMREFNLGTSVAKTYEILGVDSDYFAHLDPTEEL